MEQSPMTCRHARIIFKPGLQLTNKNWEGARFKCRKGMWLTRTEIKNQTDPQEKVYECYYPLAEANVLRTCKHCLVFKPATEESCRMEIAGVVKRVAMASEPSVPTSAPA